MSYKRQKRRDICSETIRGTLGAVPGQGGSPTLVRQKLVVSWEMYLRCWKKPCYALTSSRGRFMNWGNTGFVFEERTRFVGKETCSNNHLLCEVLLINVWCLFLDPGSFFTFSCVLDKNRKAKFTLNCYLIQE